MNGEEILDLLLVCDGTAASEPARCDWFVSVVDFGRLPILGLVEGDGELGLAKGFARRETDP